MSRYNRVQRVFPWVVVAVFLAGALLVAFAIIAGSLVLGMVGAVTVVTAGLAGVVLPHVGLSAPLSFSENFPESAGGGPQSGESPDDDQPYRKLPEIPARRLPKGPDRERSKPQHVNLGPQENLRTVGGEEVIEVPDDREE